MFFMRTLCVLLTATVINAIPFQSCNKSSDCGENSCCVSAPFMMKHCEPIGLEGDYCLTKDYSFLFNDVYFLRCPCARGFECIGGEGSFPGGKDNFLNAKCKKSTFL
ncbi:hypothetical protein X975_06617, partial [Stegodyphus mimosarum]